MSRIFAKSVLVLAAVAASVGARGDVNGQYPYQPSQVQSAFAQSAAQQQQQPYVQAAQQQQPAYLPPVAQPQQTYVAPPLPPAYMPPAPPVARANASAAAAVAPGGMSDVQLGTALRNMGFEPQALSNDDGTTTWSVKLSRGSWQFSFSVGLSQNRQYVWFYSPLTKITDAERVSPGALLKLLEWNAGGTTTFSFDPKSANRLIMSRPVPNHDLSAAQLRSAMDTFLTAIEESEPLWNERSLTTTAEARR